MSEEILGIVTPTEGKGGRYALVFTSNRVIVAKLAGFLTVLGGALGDIGGVYGTGLKLYDRKVSKKPSDLIGMSAENILKADKGNYSISYSDITKVAMKKKGLIGSAGIIISTSARNHSFIFLKEEGFKQCLNLAIATLSDKLSPV